VIDEENTKSKEEEEQEKAAYEDFYRLMGDTMRDLPAFTPGSRITGTVFSCEKDGVMLDIGYKSLAFLPANQVGVRPDIRPDEFPAVGEKIQVQVTREQDMNGQCQVSARRIKYEEAWDKVIDLAATGDELDAEVIDFNSGGVIVLVEGLKAFLPGSHLSASMRSGGDNSALVGKTLPVKFLNVDREDNKLSVSNRLAVSAKVMETMEDGKLVLGKIVAAKPYGAFVDIQGSSGLLHISQISTMHVTSVEEVLPIGTEIKAMVLKFEKATGKISLSTKVLEPEPGDMIKSPQKVYDMAEEMVAQYKERMEAEKKAREELAMEVLSGTFGLEDLPGSSGDGLGIPEPSVAGLGMPDPSGDTDNATAD
jgi:small subunit ribosomal protein S1